MRILSIHFANLNSLAGEWHIDFTDKDFLTSGIFAITGPTGAGKSTILDAICLALYGSTPRLGKISKSSNDIMTRGTGKCFAEVVFSTVHGEFRCRWSQNKAREKADGALQQASHILWDNSDGRALAEKINDVAAMVKDLTGMDFERFTQSTLLAQGSFAKFLLAKGPERAPLLEEMTGTGIYSDISAHIFSRSKAEQEKLNELDKALALCDVLSPEEEAELRENCDRLMKDIALLGAQEKELNAGLNALRTLAALNAERNSLVSQQNELEKQLEGFSPDRIRLETAHRALRFSADCSALLERQKEQGRDLEEARKQAKALGPLEQRVQAQEKLLAEAVQSYEEEKLVHGSLLETLKKVRALDVQASSKKQELTSRASACTDAERKLALAESRLSEHQASLEKQRSSLADIENWLVENAAYAELPQKLAALRVLQGQLSQQTASLNARAMQMEEKRRELEQASQLLAAQHQAHEADAQELKDTESALSELESCRLALLEGKSAAEWRREKEELARQDIRLMEMLAAGQKRSALLLQAGTLDAERLELERRIEAERSLLASEQAQMHSLNKLKQELGDSLALLDRIQSYEKARLSLQDGEACPLCGALHHPFAEGNIPTPDEKKLQLQTCEQDIQNLNEAMILRRSALAGLEYDCAHKGRASSEKKEEAEALACRIAEENSLLPPDLSALLSGNGSPSVQASALEEARSQTQLRLAEISRIVEQNDSLQEKAGTLHDSLSQLRLRSERSLREIRSLDQKTAGLQAELRHLEAEQESGLAQQENTFADMRLAATSAGRVLQDREEIPGMLDLLAERVSSFQKRQEDASALRQRCAEFEKLCLIDKQDKVALESSLQGLMREQESLASALGLLMTERRELFGELDADQEERRADVRLKNAAEHCELCRRNCEAARKAHNDTASRLSALETRIGERAGKLDADEKALLAELGKAGFSDMHRCLEACLSDEERNSLESAERALAEGMASLKARMIDNESRLKTMEAVPDLTESEVLEKLDEVQQEKDSRQEELGARRERLDRNEQNRKGALQKRIQREAQEKVCRRWADLNELIGSADGKKFRNYAQELTFRVLIGQANRQLSAMTDRYLLVQDPAEALSLSVIDRYQADAIRTSRNLSGGESFLVSLSLALGLARMASRNVRVDSVFLDEGFGTLDEDALNMALDMLSSLREQGKTIGLISHVQTIRERIGTQIHVDPAGNGRSRLSGPGIKRM